MSSKQFEAYESKNTLCVLSSHLNPTVPGEIYFLTSFLQAIPEVPELAWRWLRCLAAPILVSHQSSLLPAAGDSFVLSLPTSILPPGLNTLRIHPHPSPWTLNSTRSRPHVVPQPHITIPFALWALAPLAF